MSWPCDSTSKRIWQCITIPYSKNMSKMNFIPLSIEVWRLFCTTYRLYIKMSIQNKHITLKDREGPPCTRGWRALCMTDDMVGHISDCNLFTTQIQSAANGGQRRVETRERERAPRGRLKALCDVMEPLIRHGNEMKSSEIDTPRPREGRAREREG